MCKQKNNQSANTPSRRSFLKASSAAAGAALVGNLSISRGAHAAGSDILKFGLIGCGGRGSGAAGNVMNVDKNVRLIAMADAFMDKAIGSRDRLKNQYKDLVDVPNERCFAGFDAYRKVIDSGVDVVLIAAASGFHPKYMKEAIDAGKHVFVEKPHSIDAPGLKVVAQACAEAKKKNLSVVSGLCWRYHKGVQETVKRVHDGAIGDIVTIQETYARPPYRLTNRDPKWTEIQWQVRNWYHFKWLSGDDIEQSLVHSLDKANWLLKEKTPQTCWGVGGRSSMFEPKFGDQFDNNAMVFEYSDGARVYGFSRAAAGCHNETSDHIIGTKGSCNLLKFRIEGENKWRFQGNGGNMYDEEQRVLFNSIRNGKPVNNGKYMVGSTMLGIMGRQACYTGKKITWEQINNSTEVLNDGNVTWDTKPPVVLGKDGLYPCAVPGMTKFV
ncbi:MAG: Gfo/Idh/MocA family oxidoreductase [Pirellulales bacterium]|nr:Gfo/Idh/MocA family oxidoreductase [Pirellulales bacterium]